MQSNQIGNRLFSHVQMLASEIGERPIGSGKNHSAARYIADRMAGAGLITEYQDYPCPSWHSEASLLSVAGESLVLAANPFSPSCEIEASVSPLCTLAELVEADLQNKIALLYGDLTSRPVSPKSWFLKDERDDTIIQTLESKQPLAILTVQASKDLDRIIEDWEFGLPSATINAQSAHMLLAHPGEKVRLRLQTRLQAGETANVIGRQHGQYVSKLVVCAHYDTKFGTPGASDNAGGVAVLLELAHSLGNTRFPVGLEFVAFTGEEYLPIGDDEYLRRFPETRFGEILAVLNFDGVGVSVASSSITAMACSPAFMALAQRHSRKFPGVVWVEPWPESNHSTFAFRGVPALAFSSQDAWRLAHTRQDTPDWISPAKLTEIYELARDLVGELATQPSGWGRELP